MHYRARTVSTINKQYYQPSLEQWDVRITSGEGQEDVLGESPKLLAQNKVPSSDVLMVWHAYNLNPWTYYEDCLRKLPGLLQTGSLPLMQLAVSIDSETPLPHAPSEGQVAAFASFTGQPFDCPLNTTRMKRFPSTIQIVPSQTPFLGLRTKEMDLPNEALSYILSY
ncbi:hypothetical protein M407DRAFT_24509 [Tulasnella calospora MUT 4182]|uniref:Uncharacterized protein n=1 Tax=Tulasnella calospora MUT 4182 TaxID=1051891 RepID=A0A0C3QHP8_9AGAM|nr:hypothetical protein M407DRAFT_24509 [Tulasnella calospora MUT 4182]